MQPGIEANNPALLAALHTANASVTTAPQGSYKGQAVTLAPGGSASLQDSLEELTFTMSETGSKKLADRTTQSKSFAERLHALMAKYVTALPEALSPDELKNQYAEWLRGQAHPTSEDLKSRLGERFGDDVEAQVATLEFLDELFTEDESPAAKAAIKELKAQWKQDVRLGPLVRAGENIAPATEELAGVVDSDAGLRTFYRTVVLGWDTLDDAYSTILDAYGGGSFAEATEFLIQALGCEMQSLGPSCDPRMLTAVRDDIYYLQVVRRMHEQLEDLISRLENNYGAIQCGPRKTWKHRRQSSKKSSR